MYLVAEWTTMSAPSASGVCSAGEQKQLSTASLTPRSRAIAASPRTSVSVVSGLDGVSTYSSLVFGRMAARHASRSSWRTKLTSMPKRCRMPNSCSVAPKSS